MFIIFGTRGIKHTISESPVLMNSCPNCSNGSLVNKLYRRWFTLFFIPVIPLDVVDRFYECNNCKSAYNEKIKDILNQSQAVQENVQHQARYTYARALVAAMTHMSVIDGDFAAEEEREIMDAIEQFGDVKPELMQVMEQVKRDQNKDNFVFNLLNEARNELSAEAIMNILAQAGVVLLADGIIDKSEENLMKEYLIACGLPKDMYRTIIDKLQTKNIAEDEIEEVKPL
ncbi:TerB family tellurite resistance protein [Kordia algicida OT-1]|uniref:Zinc-ribbon 15 domain-containing protein n=1 Tax=Kordia algicida OT-1 TaxID=391587 RepID=A9EB44_9FLAO|nr:TerB family tellurite resistance protein [Kordia algicida]EDP94579.1 hypothetical protein KAOT1_10466 [Kordia algicida OT-1]